MYVKLNDEFRLRGWRDIPLCLLNIERGTVKSFDPEFASFFELLNGEIDPDAVSLTPNRTVFSGNGIMGYDATVCRFFKEGYRERVGKIIGA
jgi:hypothetical protein